MNSIAARLKSVVVLNGLIPNISTFKELLPQGLPLIAADGAAWALKRNNLIPDVIIGDLDSLKAGDDPKTNFPDSEIIEEADQESNDFEKALRFVLRRQLAPALVIGMQGGDLEHSFNNWSVAIKLAKEMELWILEQDRIGVTVGTGGFLKAKCGKDKMVSLIPQPDAEVSTDGLRWPLRKERLALGLREGARNEQVDKTFSVNVHSGSLMVFLGIDAELESLRAGGMLQATP